MQSNAKDREEAAKETAAAATATNPERSEERPHALKIQVVNACSFALSALLAIVATVMLFCLLRANDLAELEHDRYDICASAADKLMDASDYLTASSQMYVITGNERYLNNYLDELDVTKRRDEALETLKLKSGDPHAVERLAEALNESNELAELELYAMHLTALSTNLDPLPHKLQTAQLSAEDLALSAAEQGELAQSLLLGNEYDTLKNRIITDVDDCLSVLITELERAETDVQHTVDTLMIAMLVILVLLVLIIGVTVLVNFHLIMRPMRIHARNIRENEPLEPVGSYELLYVVNAYNQIYEENHRRTMLLKREAETDALTNLLNRGSYDKALKHHGDDIALAIFDVDLFKSVNDTYGHNVGDAVLRKVGAAIDYHFRATDYVCRIGGDEFAVIMTEVDPSKRGIIDTKLKLITEDLRDTSDGLPEITLSVGIAFSAETTPGENIYHAADKALYEAKHRGRNTHVFYGDIKGQ